MDHPSVRDRIRQTLASTDLTDPHDITQHLLPQLRGKAAAAALAEVLPHYVRQVFSSERTHRFDPARDDVGTHGTSAGSNRSPRWEASSVALLDVPVNVAGTYLRLGDCTADDLLWLAQDRHDKAKELGAAGDRYAALAAALTQRAAATVAALYAADPDTVTKVLT